MSDNIKEIAPPKGIKCPKCGVEIKTAFASTPEHSGQLRVGGVVICKECRCICRMTAEGLRAISREEAKTMPPQMLMNLAVIMKGLRAQERKN
jgi:hypothetical protein